MYTFYLHVYLEDNFQRLNYVARFTRWKKKWFADASIDKICLQEMRKNFQVSFRLESIYMVRKVISVISGRQFQRSHTKLTPNPRLTCRTMSFTW